eukprot:74856_1
MNKLNKPLSLIMNRTCLNSIRMLSIISPMQMKMQMRLFSNTTKEDEFKSQDETPFIYDPTHVPCEEKDFDVDPLDVRLRQPLPKEAFLPRDEVLIRMIAICEGMERCDTENKTITE